MIIRFSINIDKAELYTSYAGYSSGGTYMDPIYRRKAKRTLLETLYNNSIIDTSKSFDELTPGEIIILGEDPRILEDWQSGRSKKTDSNKEEEEPTVGDLIKKLYGSK